MSPHRRPLLRAAALLPPVVAAGALLTGCGNAGELESAGPTPTAIGPVRLWPELPPVTAPPIDYGESDSERVPGVRAPGGDVHGVDPVAVVQAEVAAHPDQYSGGDALYAETAERIRACGSRPKACPVLAPHYRDLTGDGKDELIVGIRMPDQQVGVRCYMPEKGGLTRIMSTVDQVVRVELAGRDLVLRVVSAGIPGYEYRTAWSWDDHQRTMLPTRDEIIRVKPVPPPPDPASAPDPSMTDPSAADPAATGPFAPDDGTSPPGPAAPPAASPSPRAGAR
ncbi:hypothetical protein [Streptomyces sp. SP18CS02]|uniref:hypothetical protein n=1 Tax=Streptomyces sp. SP18CS02 TaxID=3002531 RepID=UPI002E784F45|nr:hypothetical protein [Streptomyces sp. SP18CS02]MEE1757220.1 hypothetical protein [Streptomyces sp. SP18CS02]